ncbi:hypothetical protein Q8F55_004481 [Vanrija albida]|uniref:N-acetyltransferase domain-containing protein n=1 Tax=Vanrija albida TaxID=181172 RepID=A0ABR3Q6U4_9TREE
MTNLPGLHLTTARLEMRPLTRSDLGAMTRLHTDTSVMAHLGAETPADVAAALPALIEQYDHLELAPGRGGGRGLGTLVLLERHTRAWVGWVSLYGPAESAARSAPGLALAFRLTQGSWGQGYATEAARRLVEYYYSTLGGGRPIAATTPAGHGAAIRVLDKCGLRKVRGTAQGLVYAITRDEWNEADKRRPRGSRGRMGSYMA